MTSITRLTAAASIGALALAAAACTPAADNDADTAADGTDTTTIIEREVPADPVVVEREVPVPTPPVVVEDRRQGDSTTVRAGEDGIEVETTNR
ncbi:hypothetical protein N0B44_18630 [Roseibacterium beibuensis]|uniref:hypothetical protein n=1 Tax=[Roseibacterium] beibuensis TaxID=1193142 RepID=UPI00217CF43D|nr:hypothetical protein [Roseibacterium beibuensis]MCS6624933.1 hypothetical protein [Roseibacterium beibuensis]